ncbi:MAG: HutD family protein [Tissierellia bacterium]|nr:HutD family protein [Tissierellia bacterium]MDD4437265.1 HutD family protein [Tissierellia bacterium]
MKWKIIDKEDFIVTKWTGGETTQLFIYPEDAIFSEKKFLWRVSSATFTSTESKFSDFTGYQRYILPLEGELSLSHEGLYNRELDKYEVEYFDGTWTTFSKNSLDCRDYNFIVRNGNLTKMQILSRGCEYFLKESEIVTIFSMDDFVISLEDSDERIDVNAFSLLILETDDEEKISIISADSPLILSEFFITQ